MSTEDKIFEEEQKHLTETYGTIRAKEHEVSEELRNLFEKARQDKSELSEDLALSFAHADDILESNAELELVNRIIDEYNIENKTLTKQSKQLLALLEQPYFARVQVRFPDEYDAEDFYIGTAQLMGDDYEPIIVDWRSPIAEVYYNQQNGRTSYSVDGHKIEVDLELRRQFDIVGDTLNAYFDTQIAIEDPMLLKSLSRRRSDKMQSITATIQKEQNAVIRHPDVPVMMIEGTAGSGKTSVLLQRIAYLLYQKRATLNPGNVYLITLNPVFENYIANVLPDLGEENPNTLTWTAFLKECGFRSHDFQDNTTPESMWAIDEKLPTFELVKEDFKTISLKKVKALPLKKIYEIYQRNAKLGTGARLIGVMEDQMIEEAQRYMREHKNDKKGNIDELYEEVDDASFLDPDRKAKTGGATGDRMFGGADLGKSKAGFGSDDDDDDENSEKNDFNNATQAVRSFQWLDIPAIGKRLLGRAYLTDAELAYLTFRLTGKCNRAAQYVMIDEVQDYTEAQLMVLRAYFPNARFLLLGDEYQAIRSGTVTFERIREIFEGKAAPTVTDSAAALNAGLMTIKGKPVTSMKLMTSYRSSPEITSLFTSLLPKKVGMDVQSVQRPGIAPVIEGYAERPAYLEALREAIRKAKDSGELTAIVVNGRSTQDRLHSLLGEDAPHYVKPNEMIPEQGVFMITLSLSKGLEFDAVIIPDADTKTYPDTILKRHQLYTAISRATERVTLLAEGELSTLVADYEPPVVEEV